MKEVNVLGTEYNVEHERLEKCDGYCDKTLHQEFGHDEVTIDWMAAQFPKMVSAFREAGCLE